MSLLSIFKSDKKTKNHNYRGLSNKPQTRTIHVRFDGNFTSDINDLVESEKFKNDIKLAKQILATQ